MNGMGAHGGRRCIALVMQSLPNWPEALRRLGLADRLRMGLVGALTKRSCRKAALVFAQSRWMKGLLADRFGLTADRIRLAHPGTPPLPPGDDPAILSNFETAPRDPRVLSVCSDAPHKNLGALAGVLQIVRKRGRAARLFATIPVTSRFAAEDGVVEMGELGRRQLGVAYENVTVTVQASLVECSGLVPAEAMSCGCAVITPDRPWAREICGDDGLYFDPMNSGSFAKVLERFLRDEAVRDLLTWRCDGYGDLAPVSARYRALFTALLQDAKATTSPDSSTAGAGGTSGDAVGASP